MNIPNPINANAPNVAPTPTPALAPVDKPLPPDELSLSVAVGELVVDVVDVALTVTESKVDEAITEDLPAEADDLAEEAVEETIAPNVLAIPVIETNIPDRTADVR
ncbi:hypothetical protein N0V94_004556 [Neodidymelliopsis sp. IMI 364377]|nr:hypothetical protein N0V94_004556 [Neodidymelliopsis sp. IMI 364377]